jgi:hypothetical protein
MFQTKVVEKIKIHTLYSITFFENHTVYEIVWKNTLEPDRPWMTIQCMDIAFWMTKTTYTHSEYVILVAFPWQQLLFELTLVLLYMYITYLL